MNRFEEQLARLKECLGLTKDVQVAEMLGMSRAAFSNRKQLGSFPEDKVVGLKRTKPDLDVMYVLTGQRWTAGERAVHDVMFRGAAESKDPDLCQSVARAAENHARVLQDAADDPQVRELLGILVFCDRAAVAQVTTTAAKLMGPTPIPFSKREPADRSLLGLRSSPQNAIKATAEQTEAVSELMKSVRKGVGATGLAALQDEAHLSMPAGAGKAAEAVKALAKVSGRVIAVTGTPNRSAPTPKPSTASTRRRTSKTG